MKTFCTPRGKAYEEIKPVGSGAQGTASLVKDRRGNLFVLKEILVKQWSEKSRMEALKEVHAMQASCQHPNIINYHDSWFKEFKLCILMEYAPNGSLEALIRNYRANNLRIHKSEIVHYTEQLSSALEYCHNDLQIIHRDIKPGNILIDQLGNLKLADFGLSKDLTGQGMCATYVGSPLYMAPELIKGQKYTFGVDIWAFGCVMYELMAFHSPWDATGKLTSFPKLIEAIIHTRPNMEIFNGRYCTNLVKIVKWMLSKEPERRPSAAQLHDHFAVRAPPVDLTSSIIQMPTTIVRQQQMINDARQIAEAATLIQRSFRASIEKRHDNVLEPEKPMDAQRRKLVPKRPPSRIAPLRQAQPYRNPIHQMHAQVESSKIIQNAFRKSLGKNMPAGQPVGKISTRLEQLAAPRKLTPPVQDLPRGKYQMPARAVYQKYQPRPAWI